MIAALSTHASAQEPAPAPAPTETPPDDAPPADTPAHPIADELARKHYEDGRAAAEKGNWQAAYTSYRAAIAVQAHYLIHGALGEAAHHLGKDRDAAEYLSLYLASAPDTEPESARAAAKTALADARKRVGTLAIAAPDGADVLVDHVLVGKAPLGREVFVEPGRREVEARSGAAIGRQIVTAEKGASTSVTVVLGVVPPPDPTTTAPKPTAAPPPTAPANGPAGPAANRDLLIVGASIAGGTALVGGVLLAVAGAKAAEESSVRDELVALGKGNVCVATSRDPRCDQVKDAGRTVDALASTGSSLLIGGLALGAATLIYHLVTRRSAEGAAPTAPTAALIPYLHLDTSAPGSEAPRDARRSFPRGGGAAVSVRW